jgi:hypothetical protein
VQKDEFRLSPTVTMDYFTLYIPQGLDGKLTIEIFSSSGQLMDQRVIAPGSSNIRYDCSSLAEGIFIARISHGLEVAEKRFLVYR